LKNESKYYYDGMTLNNILLNTIQLDNEQRLTATFIGMGGMFTVHEGEFLNEVYYVKKINSKKQEVTINYQRKDHTLKVQNLINTLKK